MTTAPHPALAPTTWARHLVDGPTQAPHDALAPAEAERVRRHRDALLQAWQNRDTAALRQAKQEVLRAAWPGAAASPAARRALRELAWRMAALLPAYRPGRGGPDLDPH